MSASLVSDGSVSTLFIVSDATGDTAEHVVRAALLQFDLAHLPVDLRVYPQLRHAQDIDAVVSEAAAARALIVSTLVRGAEREHLLSACANRGVRCVDLLGALLGSLAAHLNIDPRGLPGGMHPVSLDYFRRIDAIEFTVRADDGRTPECLQEADLILVGISRTSKTPLSIYLAQKGYKVANVPILLDVPLPVELDSVDPGRVFALMIQPEALLNIRRQRLRHMHLEAVPDLSYGQRDHILREIYYGRALCAAHPGWTLIDVTEKAIEETAADILRSHTKQQTSRPMQAPRPKLG